MPGNIQFFKLTGRKTYPDALAAHFRRKNKRCQPDTARNVPTRLILYEDNDALAKQALKELRESGALGGRGRPAMQGLDVLYVGPPRFGKNQWTMEELERWAKACRKHLRTVMGPRSIIALFALHLDETAPHIHALVVPLTREGKLGRNPRIDEFLGELGLSFPKGRAGQRLKYTELQDHLHRTVSEEFGIQRGKKGQTRKQEPIDGTIAAELRVTIAEELREKEEEAREQAKAMRILEEGRVERIYQEAAQAEKDRDAAQAAKDAADAEKTSLDEQVSETTISLQRLQGEEREKAERVEQLEKDEARLTTPPLSVSGVVSALLPDVLVKSRAERGEEQRTEEEGKIRELKADLLNRDESIATLTRERDAANATLKKEREQTVAARKKLKEELREERRKAEEALREKGRKVEEDLRDQLAQAQKKTAVAEALSAQRKTLLDEANRIAAKEQADAAKAQSTAQHATDGIKSRLRNAKADGRRQGWKEMALKVTEVFTTFLAERAQEWLALPQLKDLLDAAQSPYTHELPDVTKQAPGWVTGQDYGPGDPGGPPR